MYGQIDNQILTSDKFICDSIDKFDAQERGFLSQAILAQLRTFVEHVMLKVYANGRDIENSYPNICKGIEHVKMRGDLKFLRRFHGFLQIVASHYTLEEENSERLMLKYYEYLLKTKEFLKTRYSLDVLGNIDRFPINTDTNLKEYHEKIAARILWHKSKGSRYNENDRFYIQKIKPFFVHQKIYYEVTFIPANGKASKFDRIIAFTDLDISKYYAVRLYLADSNIRILDKVMPIRIIVHWETSVRPCEINNFSAILGTTLETRGNSAEYRGMMQYLTQTGFNLVDILDFEDDYYQQVKAYILSTAKNARFFEVLDRCREIINGDLPGSNILRYLLYNLNNKVIKDQHYGSNEKLSGLYLSNKCIPFDQMPFNSSPIGHNPRLGDLFECIDPTNRKHELLARLIRNNTEIQGQLYTPIKDIVGLDNIKELIRTYNSTLWFGHAERRLEIRNEHIYIREYENDTLFIVDKLKEMAQHGISNYSSSVVSWLGTTVHGIDCEEKKTALTQIFEQSMVAFCWHG